MEIIDNFYNLVMMLITGILEFEILTVCVGLLLVIWIMGFIKYVIS